MGKSITFTLTLPSLPELPALPDDPWVWAEALGWLRSKGLAVAANLHDAEGAAVAEGRSGPRPPTARMDDPPVTAG